MDGPEAVPHLEDVSENNDQDLQGCTAGCREVTGVLRLTTLARMLGAIFAINSKDSTHSDYTADDQADDAAHLHFCVFLPAHVCAIVIEIARLVLEILVALGAALCSLGAIVDARD